MPHYITAEESITKSLPQMPYNIFLSADPFDDVIQISIRDFGSHQLLGFVLQQCPFRNLPQLKDILPSQPASRIKNWRSTIHWAYVTQIEEYIIKTIEDVITAVQNCREQKLKEIQVEFALDIKPGGIHPTEGLPLLYFYQLNAINHQIKEINHDRQSDTYEPEVDSPPVVPGTPIAADPVSQESSEAGSAIVHRLLSTTYPDHIRCLFDETFDMDIHNIPKINTVQSPFPSEGVPIGTHFHSTTTTDTEVLAQKFTKKQIKNGPDYLEWQQAEYQQLDQYDAQEMFKDPVPRRPDMNIWHLLWVYLQKAPPDLRKKARCVVDGSKRARHHAKVGHTFANSLASNGERVFGHWRHY
jgi:hypothetical protein